MSSSTSSVIFSCNSIHNRASLARKHDSCFMTCHPERSTKWHSDLDQNRIRDKFRSSSAKSQLASSAVVSAFRLARLIETPSMRLFGNEGFKTQSHSVSYERSTDLKFVQVVPRATTDRTPFDGWFSLHPRPPSPPRRQKRSRCCSVLIQPKSLRMFQHFQESPRSGS